MSDDKGEGGYGYPWHRSKDSDSHVEIDHPTLDARERAVHVVTKEPTIWIAYVMNVQSFSYREAVPREGQRRLGELTTGE